MRVKRIIGNLFLEELGEKALGLNGSDVATVVAPHQNAALDVQKE